MGDQISADRQAELQRYIDRWQADAEHGERRGPFDRVALTGADVYWIAEQSGRDEQRYVPNLHLAGAHLTDADLRFARLVGADLSAAHMERASIWEAMLGGANIHEAHLEGAVLGFALLDKADLQGARLEGSTLSDATLEVADLR